MNVPQETLDEWPRSCERMRVVMTEVRERLTDGDPDRAVELVEWAYVATMILGNEMQMAGAARPDTLPAPPDIPLRLLSSPANRLYAKALRHAYVAGLAVDEERGWGDTGPARLLRMLLTDVNEQVSGPVGLGESARGQARGEAGG
jgi:hypothetical protein